MFKSLRDKLPTRNSNSSSKLSETELNTDYGEFQFPPPIKGMIFSSPTDRNNKNDLYICNCCNPDDEVEDEPHQENTASVGETQKSVIMDLLNQLKFGADLTKISMPIFVLETKSLLEMFADYMAHPNIFIKICNAPDRKSRMFFIIVWYITVFHAGKKDIIAKKPFNSVIGETFHCSWKIGDEEFDTSEPSLYSESINNGAEVRIGFMAEQLSHHPPVTGFLFTCPQKKMTMSGIINTRPKFKAGTICVDFSGDVELKLTIGEKEEVYDFTLPTAYVRSILSTPYIELNGDILIQSRTNKFNGKINFIAKSMVKKTGLHKIAGEIFDLESPSSSTPFITINGTWNDSIEVISQDINLYYMIDVKRLKIYKKWLCPLSQQVPEESRRVWQEVTEAILMGNVEKATNLKKEIEDIQRLSERIRTEKKLHFPARHFIPISNDSWTLRLDYTGK